MWCRWSSTIAAVTFGVTAALVSYETTSAQQQYYYTPDEFRATMRGLGYEIPEEGPLTDEATRNAIRDFQQRYGLGVDGVAGPQTQSTAAELMRNLHGSLNLVVEPTPPLPRNQFFTTLTSSAVEQFQEQANLQTTGIANLETRTRLDQEARRILSGEEPTPTPTPTPTPSPTPGQTTPTPSPTPGQTTPTPSPTPGQTTPTPSPTPGQTTPTPSPTPGQTTPTPSPTPGQTTPTPSPTPGQTTPTPSPTPGQTTPTPSPTPGQTTPGQTTPGQTTPGQTTPTQTP